MTNAIALGLYLPLLAIAAFAVWRRPVVALFLFVVGLALHNVVLALLFGLGLDGAALTAVQAWKEIVLAVALARVVVDAVRARRAPFEPTVVDALALAFAAVVVLYSAVPQDVLGGSASFETVLYGARHALAPVAAFFLGRSLRFAPGELPRLVWTIIGTAAVVAALGLVEEYAVPVEWWRDAGVPGYYDHLGFDYHGPAELPDNFAFNSAEGVFRRLVSTFVSPLASAFMFVVALLLAAAGRPRRMTFALAAVSAAGLLFTLSRSSLLALAGALVVLAFARRRAWPLVAAVATVAAGVAFAMAFPVVAPETHFLPEDLAYQERIAKEKGGLPSGSGVLDPDEPSLESHWSSLRAGVETVVDHPQGYGPGNAGATAVRNDVRLRAGESNYTELGVEFGVVGVLAFLAWNLALLVALLRGARRDRLAAGVAASLAAVLALAVQTDAYGVPWLGYCLWSLAGATLGLLWRERSTSASTSATST